MAESVHVVCPHCDAVNRIAILRIKDGGHCGKCHRPLFSGEPLSLNTARFQKHLNRNDIPILVDFWAPWCGPCQMMAPYFVEAASGLEPEMRLVKIDTEAESPLGAQFSIRSIPTLILFKDGKEKARKSGAMGTSDIMKWAKNNVL